MNMEINLLGLMGALAAFLAIWFGHVAVRKIEFLSPTIWIPTIVFIVLGLAFEGFSLTAASRPLSTIFGITGLTFLFDAFELTRQQRRVIKGHAPANPNNPRHARILAGHSSATGLDLLKRNPLGRPVSHEEAVHLITEH